MPTSGEILQLDGVVAGHSAALRHIDALRYGATAAEIVETMQVTALVGIASVRAAAPVIREVFGWKEGWRGACSPQPRAAPDCADATLARKSTSSDRCCDLARWAE